MDEERIEEQGEEPKEEKKKKEGFFARLKRGLQKTRETFAAGFAAVFTNGKIDEEFFDNLEEVLITGDIGVRETDKLMTEIREKVENEYIVDPKIVKKWLLDGIRREMATPPDAYRFEEEKSAVLIVGVNGVGKTTTVGKLAGKMKDRGKKVVIAAADTFRAAAGEQLEEWARRADAELIGGREGSDPGSVVYDAAVAAKARNADLLLVDTAGRLHNKKNLMKELEKINRILEKEYVDAYMETLVVLDATTGQNALEQARQFMEVTKLSGIILTKMDGTAKGGIAVAIQSELKVPVKYIGVGESIDDLQKFDADSFVDAIFGDDF
jgi:fused signal recognition particle receptor